jgi:hypothetical protein
VPAHAAIPTVRSSARFDSTRRYRYSLRRRWGAGAACCFVMLNPSAADETDDDPTIRRCLGFARSWGYPALEVVNLFAWRTHEPRRLLGAIDPVGPANDDAVRRAAGRAGLIVCAWGASLQAPGSLARDRAARTMAMLAGRDAVCLGMTKGGHPRHPLYVRGDAQARPFRMSD